MYTMYRYLLKLFRPTHPEKIQLGRWNLKTCEELSTSINSIYQNRDHCSDVVCKTPRKAADYMDTKMNSSYNKTKSGLEKHM